MSDPLLEVGLVAFAIIAIIFIILRDVMP